MSYQDESKMFLCRYFAVFLTVATAISALPGNFRNRAATIAVRGAQGGLQPRLEIRNLAQNADQWNIFLLGLARFQAMEISETLSYYQIAGIHGASWGTWDNFNPCAGCSNCGYCAHSSTMFPTWHRPYLALFEQSLQTNAIAAANDFTGSDKLRYVSAATNLRLPYWDWAMTPASGQTNVPDFLTNPTIQVHMPNGSETIPNPLYAYQFPAKAKTPRNVCRHLL